MRAVKSAFLNVRRAAWNDNCSDRDGGAGVAEPDADGLPLVNALFQTLQWRELQLDLRCVRKPVLT